MDEDEDIVEAEEVDEDDDDVDSMDSFDIDVDSSWFGEPQEIEPGVAGFDTYQIIRASNSYMRVQQLLLPDEDEDDDILLPFRPSCRNRDALCSFWAAHGECRTNAAYMQEHCAPA